MLITVDGSVANELVTWTRRWGWTNPPRDIVEIAQQAQRAADSRSGDLLVSLGVVSEQRRDQLLATKPAGVQTIAWFAEQEPAIVPVAERALALINGYPYYDQLALLTIHPAMRDEAVRRRADEIDAALMLIEESVPVLVFSTFGAMVRWRTIGRGDRQHDAIVRAVGHSVHLAVGARDEVSGVLAAVGGGDDTAVHADLATIWHAAAVEHQSRPENRAITRLIDHAIRLDATDIALKPYRTGELHVQLRRFGLLVPPTAVDERIAPDLAAEVVRLLQSRSGANPSNTRQRLPTDGHITYRSSSGEAFLRLSFMPLNHLGDMRNLTSLALRVLPRHETSVSFGELSLDSQTVDEIRFAMRLSHGMVLVVGPTGSGKSSTIAAALGAHVELFGDTLKRVSAEDPIERYLYGVQQYQAPAHLDEEERYQVLLRGFKRHDPDVIWIGEIRGEPTAKMAIDSAATGHLVLSTLHASDTVVGFDVLAKMVPPEKRFQLIESLSLIVAQRLVPVVCPNPECTRIEPPSDEERSAWARYTLRLGVSVELPETVAHRHPNKECKTCGGDGYVSLQPVVELLPFGRAAKDAAIKMLTDHAARGLANLRRQTLVQSARDLLAHHQTDFASALI